MPRLQDVLSDLPEDSHLLPDPDTAPDQWTSQSQLPPRTQRPPLRSHPSRGVRRDASFGRDGTQLKAAERTLGARNHGAHAVAIAIRQGLI